MRLANHNKLSTRLELLAIAALLMAGATQAENDTSGSSERGQRRGPPAEAIDACAALVEGDACSFTGRCDQEVSGSCATGRMDELVCKPADRDRGAHRHGHDRGQNENENENES